MYRARMDSLQADSATADRSWADPKISSRHFEVSVTFGNGVPGEVPDFPACHPSHPTCTYSGEPLLIYHSGKCFLSDTVLGLRLHDYGAEALEFAESVEVAFA